MIRAVDHINIATEQLEKTRDFFVEALGMEEGPRPNFNLEGYWIYAGGRALVHLQRAKGPVGPTRDCALNHAAFEVGDIDALAARLDARGLEYRRNEVPGVVRQIFVEDPNGVMIELNARLAPG